MFIKDVNENELKEYINDNYREYRGESFVISVTKDLLYGSEAMKLALDKLNEDILTDKVFSYIPSSKDIIAILLDIIQNCFTEHLMKLFSEALISYGANIIGFSMPNNYFHSLESVSVQYTIDFKQYFKQTFLIKTKYFNHSSEMHYSIALTDLRLNAGQSIKASEFYKLFNNDYYKELSIKTSTIFRNKFFPNDSVDDVCLAMHNTIGNISSGTTLDLDNMLRLCNDKISRYRTIRMHGGNVVSSKKVFSIDDLIASYSVKFRFNKYTGNKTKYYDMITAELTLMKRGRNKKEQMEVIKKYKKKLLRIIIDKLKTNKNFIKSEIPINFLKIGDIVYRNDDVLQVTFEIKGNEAMEE